MSGFTLSKEMHFVAACCRPRRDPERNDALRYLDDELDWDRVERIGRRHRVTGLLADAFPLLTTPPPEATRLSVAAEASRIARDNLSYAAESRRLQNRFREAGLDSLVMKGVTLNALAYGTLAIKEARDIDLLVRPEDLRPAARLLAELGYRRISPSPELGDEEAEAWLADCKESSWLNDKGLLVELHTALADHPGLIPGIGMDSPRQRVKVAPGLELETLAEDELFAYLAVHGATHGWARLKWLADIAALLQDKTPEAVERLYRRSVELGAGRCGAQALVLCQRLLGLRLPPALQAELERDKAVERLVAVAMDLIAGRFEEKELDDSRFGTVPLHFAHFLLTPTWGGKAAALRQKLMTPHGGGRRRLPKALAFLTPALSLPIWLWRRAGLRHKQRF